MTEPVRTTAAKAEGRYSHLDGLRGVAALGVLLSHSFQFFFPSMHAPEDTDRISLLIGSSPLSAFYNGQFSVYVFFVLSGVVLSASVHTLEATMASSVARRYVRLTLPILATSFLYLIAARIGWLAHAPSDPSLAYAASIYPATFAPSLWDWLVDSLFNVYWTGDSKFNAVLWTMKVELWGSLLVYAAWFYLQHRVLRCALVLASAVLLFIIVDKDSSLQGIQLFPVGVLLYEAWQDRARFGRFLRWPAWLGLVILLFAISLGAWRIKDPALPGAQVIAEALLAPVVGHISRFEAHQTAAILLVAAVMFTPWLRRPFASPPLKFLGDVSFPLYLSHILVLSTLGYVSFEAAQGAFGVYAARGIAIPIGIIASLLLARLLVPLVEAPSISVSRSLGDIIRRKMAGLLGRKSGRHGAAELAQPTEPPR